MAHYRVLYSSSHSVTLEDDAGRRHVARAVHDAPSQGAELHGPHAARGFAILSHPASMSLCRVIFEEVNCDQAHTGSGRHLQ
jgi:hypothetical protein